MIARMKFFTLTGPVNDLDRIINRYVSKYDIQIENAVAELKEVRNLRNHSENNPYKEILSRANEYISILNIKETNVKLSIEEAQRVITDFGNKLYEINKNKSLILGKLEHQKDLLRDIIPYSEIHYDVQSILHFRFVKYRFGKIAKEYYQKLADFMQQDICSIFCKCECDADYVWGVYFVPESESKQIDAIYSAMHFERFYLSDEYEGMVDEAKTHLEKEIAQLQRELTDLEINEEMVKDAYAENVIAAQKCIDSSSKNYDIRKQAAYKKKINSEFFIMCGWMLEDDAKNLEQEISEDSKIYMIYEEHHEGPFGGAPIQLKNPKILKPFELLIKMYGLPNYEEFDPTFFVALSYINYLNNCVRKALSFAKGVKVDFYIDSSDVSLINQINNSVNLNIEVSEENLIGGMRAAIPSKNVLIDESFSAKLLDEQRKFKF